MNKRRERSEDPPHAGRYYNDINLMKGALMMLISAIDITISEKYAYLSGLNPNSLSVKGSSFNSFDEFCFRAAYCVFNDVNFERG